MYCFDNSLILYMDMSIFQLISDHLNVLPNWPNVLFTSPLSAKSQCHIEQK
ncbi:hypothetical protein GPLA_4208 [Paraglaciecola polaris LMG 21857]|uniref:Uncharacterized protein n=1 Tax=Paraglaciecola polaris LMG 21857 TaxID=1129793 RepID=K6ZXY0_9ALTE|nr:hypothetical protein GPLA_4208 [Paraglaciecola polaris LMG 21857]